LPAEDRRRIGEDIKTVEFGWPLGMPTCRPLGEGLHEVRTDLTGNRTARNLLLRRSVAANGAAAWHGQANEENTRNRSCVGQSQQAQAPEESRMIRRTAGRAKRHSGSTLDSLLEEEGILDDVEAVAIKRVIAWQLVKTMKQNKITKKAMAARMQTSRSQLDRLLDPENAAVHLATITRAARVIGKKIRLRLVDAA
jgi:antitoxin HicB